MKPFLVMGRLSFLDLRPLSRFMLSTFQLEAHFVVRYTDGQLGGLGRHGASATEPMRGVDGYGQYADEGASRLSDRRWVLCVA